MIRFALGDVGSKYIHSCVISRKNPNPLSGHSVPARQTTVSIANPTLQLQAVWRSSGYSIYIKDETIGTKTSKNNNVHKALYEHNRPKLSGYRKSTYDPKPKTKRSLEFTDASSKKAFNKHLNKMYSLSPASSKQPEHLAQSLR